MGAKVREFWIYPKLIYKSIFTIHQSNKFDSKSKLFCFIISSVILAIGGICYEFGFETSKLKAKLTMINVGEFKQLEKKIEKKLSDNSEFANVIHPYTECYGQKLETKLN